jgi:hypothetical protein
MVGNVRLRRHAAGFQDTLLAVKDCKILEQVFQAGYGANFRPRNHCLASDHLKNYTKSDPTPYADANIYPCTLSCASLQRAFALTRARAPASSRLAATSCCLSMVDHGSSRT